MRIINADEFDERIRAAGGFCEADLSEDFKEGVLTVLEMLKTQPTIKPEQQWIPCSERLPEKDGDYLVCYEEGYRQDYGLDEIGIAPFEVDCEGFGIWQESFDRYTLGSLGSEWVDIPVIAWMPLPEPWKGDRHEAV